MHRPLQRTYFFYPSFIPFLLCILLMFTIGPLEIQTVYDFSEKKKVSIYGSCYRLVDYLDKKTKSDNKSSSGTL